MKKNQIRLLANIIFGVLLTFIAISGVVWITQKSYQSGVDMVLEDSSRHLNKTFKEVEITVTPTTTLDSLADYLLEQDLIGSKQWFVGQGTIFGYSNDLVPGTYTIHSTMSNTQILDTVTADATKEQSTVTVTIPEGYTISQIASTLESYGVVDSKSFLAAVDNSHFDYHFLADIPTGVKYRLEGYLFPDTYFFNKNSSAEEVIDKMLQRFEQVINKYAYEFSENPYTLHEILTIASLVENEARLTIERPMIAGVIYNRLHHAMALQLSSTVQYSLTKRITEDDLVTDSLYNTYLYLGLPIGPISCPGEEALLGAIVPDEHNYFYYVLKESNTGSHAFSTTLDEHTSNKYKYLQNWDINFRTPF
ncbi:MAG: hypothetical protein ATN36_08545 [Epulopiscium sp. Nele67-Bin005]|nr:MAG: hypothetical protein ATN36_08545 [Epulopiscium sp. Nele67-Bin005]